MFRGKWEGEGVVGSVDACDCGTVYCDGHADISPASEHGASLLDAGYTVVYDGKVYSSLDKIPVETE
jgi:hypothetical protein